MIDGCFVVLLWKTGEDKGRLFLPASFSLFAISRCAKLNIR